ncbi:MAG TPA: zinc ribbon domain-containing protein [Anaerolineaceae bacterium]|nr:zinc ribbon domain-containing protein [Anaerolineaceae bacterium]
MTFDPLTLSTFTLLAAALGAAFLVALWISLIFWTYRDIRTRVRDPLVRILAAMVVAVLFLPGILIYLILRPARTLEEDYQRALEDEALLQSVEESSLCPGCGRQVHEEWVACPSCHTRLRKPCHQCGRLMELAWNLCPYCGTPAPGMRRESLSMEDALQTLPPSDVANAENLEDTLHSLPSDPVSGTENAEVSEETGYN